MQYDFFDNIDLMLVNFVPYLLSTNPNDVSSAVPGNETFLTGTPTSGGLSLSGTIHSDFLLSASLSPYFLTGTLLVGAGAKLAIAPGTEIRASPGATIQVDGILLAEGSVSLPIVFTSTAAVGAAGDWHGIEFRQPDTPVVYNTSTTPPVFVGGSLLKYCIIRFAGKTLSGTSTQAIVATKYPPYLSDVTVENSYGAVSFGSLPHDSRVVLTRVRAIASARSTVYDFQFLSISAAHTHVYMDDCETVQSRAPAVYAYSTSSGYGYLYVTKVHTLSHTHTRTFTFCFHSLCFIRARTRSTTLSLIPPPSVAFTCTTFFVSTSTRLKFLVTLAKVLHTKEL